MPNVREAPNQPQVTSSEIVTLLPQRSMLLYVNYVDICCIWVSLLNCVDINNVKMFKASKRERLQFNIW